jgi:hypothetical protein
MHWKTVEVMSVWGYRGGMLGHRSTGISRLASPALAMASTTCLILGDVCCRDAVNFTAIFCRQRWADLREQRGQPPVRKLDPLLGAEPME